MSTTIKKSLNNSANSIKDTLKDVVKSVKNIKESSIKKNSLEKTIKNSINSLSNISNKISNNNNIKYLGIFIIIALTIGYFVNKHFNAMIFLYLILALSFLLTKNLFYSLLISILVTNFLLSINFFVDSKKEGYKEKITNKAKKKLIQDRFKKVKSKK